MDQRMDRVLANDSGVTEGGKRCSRRKPKSSSRDSTGLVTQNHRPRPELLAAHEPQIEPLAQAGEQRRPWPARMGCTTNSYSSINPRSAKATGSFTPPTNRPLPGSRLSC